MSYTDPNGVTYSYGGTTATITGYVGSSPNVTIPPTIQPDISGPTYQVITFESQAFIENSTIQNIDLTGCIYLETTGSEPFRSTGGLITANFTGCTSLTSIGYQAFVYSGLQNIILTGCTSLTTFGINSFYQTRLSSISIPPSVTNLDGATFLNSSILTSVNFEGLTIPIMGSDCFNNIGSPSIVYYQYGTTNLSYLTAFGFFSNYVEMDHHHHVLKKDLKIL